MRNNLVNLMIGFAILAIMSVPLYFLGRWVLPLFKDATYYPLPYATEIIAGLATVVAVGFLALVAFILIKLTIVVGQGGRILINKIRMGLRKTKNSGTGW